MEYADDNAAAAVTVVHKSYHHLSNFNTSPCFTVAAWVINWIIYNLYFVNKNKHKRPITA